MLCLSEVFTITDGDEAVGSLYNEILFSLITLSSSTLLEVSSIETLLPKLSNLVSMLEFFIFFFILVCNSFFRRIFFSIFSLLSFKINFYLFLQNRRFFALPISIDSSLVSFDNYSGVNLETTLDK